MILFSWLLSVLEWSKSSYSISKYYFGSIFFLLWFQNSNYIGVLSPHCFLCISYCIICISIIFFSPSFILNIFCLICFQFIKPLFNTCQSTVLFFDCLFTELLNLYYLVLGFLITTHTNMSVILWLSISFFISLNIINSDLKVFDYFNVLVPGGASLLLSIILSIVYIGFHLYCIFLSVCQFLYSCHRTYKIIYRYELRPGIT